MMKTTKMLCAVAALFCVACFAGCQPNDGLCPVEGTVTLDGQPLEEGSIGMGPMVGQPGTAVGGKILNGAFKLRASEGEMLVTIRSQKKVPIENPTPDEAAHGVAERTVELVPAKYNDRSELKFTVVKGKNQATFDLVSESTEE
ncbi:MAG: hypothetical protein Q4Q42_03945 [Planctomycetia bacterium]|nr:hypothetical protein [Planctomycetia bacterium]